MKYRGSIILSPSVNEHGHEFAKTGRQDRLPYPRRLLRSLYGKH